MARPLPISKRMCHPARNLSLVVVAALAATMSARVAHADAAAPPASSENVRRLALEAYSHEEIVVVRGTAYRGGIPLSDDAFYDAVGRPDLAARYRRAATTKRIVAVVGATTAAAGLAWGIADLLWTVFANAVSSLGCSGYPPSYPYLVPPREDCPRQGASPVPWVVVVSSGTVALGALAAPAHPTSLPRRASMAREQNQRAAARLGLGVGPLPGDGAFMMLNGTF